MTMICDDPTQRESQMTGELHLLRATPGNIYWGYFDAALAPVLKVRPGDIIQAEAVTHHAGDAPELMMDTAITAIFSSVPENDRTPGVHIMTGPIFVEGARPGDILEVRYLQMTPRLSYGSNLAAHWGYLYKEMGEKERVPVRPHLGTAGVAPNEPGDPINLNIVWTLFAHRVLPQ